VYGRKPGRPCWGRVFPARRLALFALVNWATIASFSRNHSENEIGFFMPVSMTNRDYFEAYLRTGLRVIPLLPKSKVPIGKNWNDDWSADRGREVFARNPDANLGLLLGRVVDVEGDTEEANHRLGLLTAGCPHPTYRSSKSVHHLFLNPDPGLTVLAVDGIEFRADRHQSVLPPSSHSDGTRYAWLAGTVFPIPPMPEPLLRYYRERKPRPRRAELKPDHVKVWCCSCEKPAFLHEQRYQAEKIAFRDLRGDWRCRSCRGVDVRPAARKYRKLLRRR
jgi:hypothetical protein